MTRAEVRYVLTFAAGALAYVVSRLLIGLVLLVAALGALWLVGWEVTH